MARQLRDNKACHSDENSQNIEGEMKKRDSNVKCRQRRAFAKKKGSWKFDSNLISFGELKWKEKHNIGKACKKRFPQFFAKQQYIIFIFLAENKYTNNSPICM